MQENSSKELIIVPPTVTKHAKRGMPNSFAKPDNSNGFVKKDPPENIDNIIKQSLQIRAVSNSPQYPTEGQNQNEKKSN